MGANDAKEMLEVAKAECLRLERENTALRAQVVPQPDREALGEIIALTDDYDGCHARVREWEALEQWERDAYPEDYPSSDYEDAECWNRRADAVLAALSAQTVSVPEIPDNSAQTVEGEVEWEYGWSTGSTVTWLGSREVADAYAARFKPPAVLGFGDWGSRFVRRHPAGPWIEVQS